MRIPQQRGCLEGDGAVMPTLARARVPKQLGTTEALHHEGWAPQKMGMVGSSPRATGSPQEAHPRCAAPAPRPPHPRSPIPTLFFSSFCLCRSSRTARRFSAFSRCSSRRLRRSSSCFSRSSLAFSSFSSHSARLAAVGGSRGSGVIPEAQPRSRRAPRSGRMPVPAVWVRGLAPARVRGWAPRARGAGGIAAGRQGRGLGEDKREAGSPPSCAAPANNGGMRVERARGQGGPMRRAGAPLALCPEPLRGCLQLPAAACTRERAGHGAGGSRIDRGAPMHPGGTWTTWGSQGSTAAGAAVCRGGSGVLEGAEPLAQQLLPGLSSSQLMGLPVTRQSSLAPASPAIHFPSQRAPRGSWGLTSAPSHPAPPFPYPGTWPAPRAAPSPACASPGLSGHLQRGDTIRTAPDPPRPSAGPAPVRHGGIEQCPQGASVPGAPRPPGHPPCLGLEPAAGAGEAAAVAGRSLRGSTSFEGPAVPPGGLLASEGAPSPAAGAGGSLPRGSVSAGQGAAAAGTG